MAADLRIECRDAASAYPEVARLEPAVYTPEKMAHVAWHEVEWAHAERWVLGWLDERLVSCAGIHRREIALDGAPKAIAGIGGVMTHPDHQCRGYSTQVLDEANAAIAADIAPAFSLIFVEPHNVDFYAHRGWGVFEGETIVEERGRRRPFPYMGVMLRDGTEVAPERGTIDMLGKPW